jgi:hypothetical protein
VKRGSPQESGLKEADGESSRKAMILHINESFNRPQAGLTEERGIIRPGKAACPG